MGPAQLDHVKSLRQQYIGIERITHDGRLLNPASALRLLVRAIPACKVIPRHLGAIEACNCVIVEEH